MDIVQFDYEETVERVMKTHKRKISQLAALEEELGVYFDEEEAKRIARQTMQDMTPNNSSHPQIMPAENIVAETQQNQVEDLNELQANATDSLKPKNNTALDEIIQIMIARFQHLVDRGFLAPHFLNKMISDPNEILKFVRQNRAVVGDQLNRRLDPTIRPTPAELESKGIVPVGYFSAEALAKRPRRRVPSTKDIMIKQPSEAETIEDMTMCYTLEFESKPYGFRIVGDDHNQNAVIKAILNPRLVKSLYVGSWITQINDIVVDTCDFSGIISVLRDAELPVSIRFRPCLIFIGTDEQLMSHEFTPNLSIEVSDTGKEPSQQKQGKPFVAYNLFISDTTHKTIPLKWQLWKRYSQFETLHKQLVRLVPDLAARLPPKQHVGRFKPGFIQERRVQLQRYIDEIKQHPCIVNSNEFRNFLIPTSSSACTVGASQSSSKDIMINEQVEDMHYDYKPTTRAVDTTDDTNNATESMAVTVTEYESRIIQHLQERGYDESHAHYERYAQKARGFAIEHAKEFVIRKFKKELTIREAKERQKMFAQRDTVDVSSIARNDDIVSFINHRLRARPKLEDLVALSILDIELVNQYHYTVSANEICNVMRENLNYSPDLIELLRDTPFRIAKDELRHVQRISVLFETLNDALRNACLLVQTEEADVLAKMQEMNIHMAALRMRLSVSEGPDETMDGLSPQDEQHLKMQFSVIQSELANIQTRQNIVHTRLEILRTVEDQMTALYMLGGSFMERYRMLYNYQQMVDSDLKQLQTIIDNDDDLTMKMEQSLREDQATMMRDMDHMTNIQTLSDFHRRIAITRVQNTSPQHYTAQLQDPTFHIKLTYGYSVFAINLFHRRYVHAISESTKRIIGAYAAEYEDINPVLTVQNVLKQAENNPYPTMSHEDIVAVNGDDHEDNDDEKTFRPDDISNAVVLQVNYDIEQDALAPPIEDPQPELNLEQTVCLQTSINNDQLQEDESQNECIPVFCPNDHALSQFQTPNYSFRCDGCKQKQRLQETMYGCRPCNYDLCAECHHLKSRPIQPIDVSPISCNDLIISQMNLMFSMNRPSIEKLVIDGVLEMESVNRYYYTLDVHAVNNTIRELCGLGYNPIIMSALEQYPDDVVHSNKHDFELVYKQHLSSLLLLTVSDGLRNACTLTNIEEQEVLGLMEEMNLRMKELRARLDKYFETDDPDIEAFQAEEDAVRTDFHSIQTQLLSISAKQNAIHEKLKILHSVERVMIELQNTSHSQYRLSYGRIITIDADIEQLRDYTNEPHVQDAIDGLMTYKTNLETDVRKISTQIIRKSHDLHRQICISRTQGTHYASEFRLTFQYSLFVVNILHLQYVDALTEPIKCTIAAYASDYLHINDALTVRDVLKLMDVNAYTTQHRETLLNRKDLLSIHRSVRIIHDTQDDDAECLSLHRFKSEDVCDTITKWMHNDIKYKKYLSQTQEVLCKRDWTGSKLSRWIEDGLLSTDDIKRMLQMDLNAFITPETLEIIFVCFDRWMNEYPEIESLSAEEIGSIFFDFPLNQLLDTIREKDIDGTAWMDMYAKEELEEFISEQTGWDEEEIYQLNAVLFMHKTWTKQEFVGNMTRIMNDETFGFADSFKEVIKQTVLEFNVEKLHFKIKHGMEIQAFSDTAVNLVDYVQDMNDEYVQNRHADAYPDDDLVRRVYECVADCFILKYTAPKTNEEDEDESDDDMDEFSIPLDKQTPWICANCSNFNFHKTVGGVIQSDLTVCSLCGIHQRDAIILKLRNYDTYIMVSTRTHKKDEQEDESAYDAIDSLINTASDHPSYNLHCPNRNDNRPCPAMLTLARNLIIYKRWIQTVFKKTNGKDDIDKTIRIDIPTYIDDKQYKIVFMESAKNNRLLASADLELITQLLNSNADDIGSCATFAGWKRLAFIKWFRKHSERKIKPAALGRLYTTVRRTLIKQAQVPQFGQFLSEVAMRGIDKDYYHILKAHVYHGTKETIKNVFRFFQIVVHYEDTQKEINECRSCKRREDRIHTDHQIQNTDANKESVQNTNQCDDKHIWSLQQYYIQSQLDKIHSYLVHSNWKYFVQRYAKDNKKEDDDEATNDDDDQEREATLIKEEEKEFETDAMATADAAAQKSKFTSDSDSYGFGVDHSYPHLTDIHCSIQDELVLNTLYPLSVAHFQNLLIKAIKTHEIALSKGYKEDLICKYFNSDYNILRNEPIQIRHILALIIYTDLTQFCTVLRQTYRKKDDESEDEQVSERHQQLYHYSRSLFEAVEFYGQFMEPNLTVYHGLNKVLFFHHFTAYFFQPISTTTSFQVANQFSDGCGIILSLKSGSGAQQSEDTIPKYLNVSWLSNFPHEDEKLFYGGYEVFKISNIFEAASRTGHAKELFMFNKFQQMIQNHKVEWNTKHKLEKKMIKALVTLIEFEQNNNDNSSDEIAFPQAIANNKLITKYGMNLFHYFCTNNDTTKVEIKNVKSLPSEIYNALFTAKKNNKISFIPITKVFKWLKEITLTDLKNGQFTKESKYYVDAAMQCIQKSQTKLRKITLQSERVRDRKTNTTLKKLANYNVKKFKKLKWKIEYDFREYDTHMLVLTKLD